MSDNSNKKQLSRKLRWPRTLMTLAIIGVTGFQLYWLKNNYDREKQNLELNTMSSFRETILNLQASKLKFDRINIHIDSTRPEPRWMNRPRGGRPPGQPPNRKESVITMVNLLQKRMRDSAGRDTFISRSPAIDIRESPLREMHLDSIPATRIRTVGITTRLDSIDPRSIRRVEVRKDKNSPGGIITIDMRKPHDSMQRMFSPESAIEDIFITQNKIGRQPDSSRLSEVPVAGYSRQVISQNKVAWQPDSLRMTEVPVAGYGGGGRGNNAIFRFLYDIDSIAIRDSITVKEVIGAYEKRLKEDNISVGFNVNRQDSTQEESPNEVTIGFAKPARFALELDHTIGYMLGKLKLPILFSILLIGITVGSFVLLYRNMVKQYRLAELKNEFISNITHELKTPIATVGVAIEALKNFNAIEDPQRTREYLDISQNELQRLNLLVDKVLKLSIFEKKAIELKKETFDCKQLMEEVMNTMKLQFEKYHANATLITEGDNFLIEADKLHITSVIYNLLDNALKYSAENPVIDVQLKSISQQVQIIVRDNGIGIPNEYQGKIFDKFFRVPTGNKHNIKGYGLGLSYVSEVVKQHHGTIEVSSEQGKGSTFTVSLPVSETA